MSEEITYPPMYELNQLLPLDALFVYCAFNLGEFTIDKENKTIVFNQVYNFNENMILEWEAFLANAKTQYDAGLASGQSILANDQQLFDNCNEMINIVKAAMK
tara:strand:+ start:510 stop:818 length:309 start_codon:yes stop_codon:yes gene_type:complete